jgi:hypothetical protein
MSYDSPNYAVRREHFGGETTAAATTEAAKFRTFQKTLLKKVHAVVTTAGTATTHGYAVYSGTTSIGSIALGTAAAGTGASSALLNAVIPSFGQVSVKSLADAAGKAHILYEYEMTADGVTS